MSRQTIFAHSIARPLQEELRARPFSGRVLGVFNRACNLIDEMGRIIALVLPAVGNGPFAIVIEDIHAVFEALVQDQPVWANHRELSVGRWYISLNRAEIWEPRIDLPCQPFNLDLMIDLIKSYAYWPNFTKDTPIAKSMAQEARQAAMQLAQAVTQSAGDDSLQPAVVRLAGLGSGLTPAGDDYLLGTMAALWLTGQSDNLSKIAEFAGPKTNALGRSFLNAAARGEFMEPWHTLAQTWHNKDDKAIIKAIEQVARFGASSGLDALAGFVKTLLSLPRSSIPSQW